MTGRELEPTCMICGGPFDAEESEKHVGDGGVEYWVLWTYCRACDCWTEHRPDDMPEGE